MQSKVTPGSICTDEALLGRRDAFHAPCVLVKCASRVIPGDQVTFASATEVVVAATGPIQGVVDPFYLARFIAPGELFWVFLMPELVSNLRHHFDIAGIPVGKDADAEAEIERLKEQIYQIEHDSERWSTGCGPGCG